MGSSRLEIDLDPLLDELADRIAARLAHAIGGTEQSPWMRMEEAVEYTRIPEGTFRSSSPKVGSRRTAEDARSSTALRSMLPWATSIREHQGASAA